MHYTSQSNIRGNPAKTNFAAALFAQSYFKLLSLSLVSGLLQVSCGKEAVQPAKAAKTADASAEPACDEKACPAVTLAINASPMENGKLMGSVANATPFIIEGSAQGATSRDIRMKAFNPAIGGTFEGQGSLRITASYVANDATVSQAPIEVVIRDVSRCKFDAPADKKSTCENLDIKGLETYETRQNFSWEITLGDSSQFGDPSFLQAQPEMVGGNAGINGCTNGLVGGFIPGLLQGNILGGALGGIMGCISGGQIQ